MVRCFIALALAFFVSAPDGARSATRTLIVAAAPANADVQLFATEAAALKHEVFWFNTASGICHDKGCAGTAAQSMRRTCAARKQMQPAIATRGTGSDAR